MNFNKKISYLITYPHILFWQFYYLAKKLFIITFIAFWKLCEFKRGWIMWVTNLKIDISNLSINFVHSICTLKKAIYTWVFKFHHYFSNFEIVFFVAKETGGFLVGKHPRGIWTSDLSQEVP